MVDYAHKDLKRIHNMIERPSDDQPPLKPEDIRRQKEDARDVANYAMNREDCRRVLILNEFREQYHQDRCEDGCDNCVENDNAVLQDVTHYATQILSLVESAIDDGIDVTEGELVSTYKGRKLQPLSKKGLDRLPLYAAGSDVEDKLIRRMVGVLLRLDALRHFDQAAQNTMYHATYVKVCF